MGPRMGPMEGPMDMGMGLEPVMPGYGPGVGTFMPEWGGSVAPIWGGGPAPLPNASFPGPMPATTYPEPQATYNRPEGINILRDIETNIRTLSGGSTDPVIISSAIDYGLDTGAFRPGTMNLAREISCIGITTEPTPLMKSWEPEPFVKVEMPWERNWDSDSLTSPSPSSVFSADARNAYNDFMTTGYDPLSDSNSIGGSPGTEFGVMRARNDKTFLDLDRYSTILRTDENALPEISPILDNLKLNASPATTFKHDTKTGYRKYWEFDTEDDFNPLLSSSPGIQFGASLAKRDHEIISIYPKLDTKPSFEMPKIKMPDLKPQPKYGTWEYDQKFGTNTFFTTINNVDTP